jgi:putative toxin-antitoxin system antitoxin component (TIGR02293 family)
MALREVIVMPRMSKQPGGTKQNSKTLATFTELGVGLSANLGSPAELTKQIKSGLRYQELTDFQRHSELPLEWITKILRLPKRTMARRKKTRKLSSEESERLIRLSLLFDKATSLFEGDKLAARNWLNRPCKGLGDVAPLVLAETEMGARAVEDLIGQLEHGVFA